ncbi:muts domain V-domain-containing protein [Biscogniauxia sp. FL1348]|nr:muts domain V-domain-containing protein [Biscogniauxia sp. FL1348]
MTGSSSCRRFTTLIPSRSQYLASTTSSYQQQQQQQSLTPFSSFNPFPLAVAGSSIQTRGKKTKSSVSLKELPQGALEFTPLPEFDEDAGGPAYPTVVLQARRNMQKFEKCVLLTRVGGFYELYFEQAEEYAPLLNLKLAQKKTNAGPVPMAGFPFMQLDKYLKILVLDFNCYVAVAEEFPNDPGDKIKSGGLMHDRRVTRIITPGTLIDENFIDPYANNYIMAIHVGHFEQQIDPAVTGLHEEQSEAPGITPAPIGLAWLDVSTGQFYTQSTTVTTLSSILSRVGPREIVLDAGLEAQHDHRLFSVLEEDKHLITFAPGEDHLPVSEWSSMLESPVTQKVAESFTPGEVHAGSLLLQYVKSRLQGLSMKLQTPQRHEDMSVMAIDKNTMRSLEIKQTIRDGVFRGSLLHAVRRTVTKGGARLLSSWLSAPSTSLETIRARQDLVEHFIQNEEIRGQIVLLLRQSSDSQRLVQKFAIGRGDPDDLIALANTIRATQDIIRLLTGSSDLPDFDFALAGGEDIAPTSIAPCFAPLVTRIQLEGPLALASRIRASIDEDSLYQKHEEEDKEARELLTLAGQVVAAEASQGERPALPKSTTQRVAKKATTSLRDYHTEDNLIFVMKPSASVGLQDLHSELSQFLEEKEKLGETLRNRLDAPSLTLRWSPNLGHYCHVKGKDARDATAARLVEMHPGVRAVSSSRSTRAYHIPAWTLLGQKIHQVRFQIQTEEQRIAAALRTLVVSNLVRLRRNAAVLDELDVTASFARLAVEHGFTRPILNDSTSHVIIGGRHPTVEGGLREQGRSFTKNDCLVGTTGSADGGQGQGAGQLWLITGPNMAGKSTYLRQNALITIMAQSGCYVPAEHASLGLVDAVFSRVGSADNLYHDQSTFMVEMLETAQILRAATPRSFVIMDEVGRGTTPSDGTAVAFAALHHLATVNRCRTLFATHFHAIADLAAARGLTTTGGSGPVDMYTTDVEEDPATGTFVYLHRLRRGINRQSHALKVARLAGLPEAAIAVASDVLATTSSSALAGTTTVISKGLR